MPEEINRILTDHISNLLFAPTKNALINLKKEGITAGVYETGDVMVDMLESTLPIAKKESMILDRLGLVPRGYLLVTMHRPANTNDPGRLRAVLTALGKTGRPVIFPAHPRTLKALNESGLLTTMPWNVPLIKSLGYVDLLRLLSGASCVITDSGGIQKEAFLLMVRCVILRENTEWTETIIDGRNTLVGAHEEEILAAIEAPDSGRRSKARPFGRPGASARIASIIDTQ